MRFRAPDIPRLVTASVLIPICSMAVRVPTSPDTWWHLRCGEVEWRTRQGTRLPKDLTGFGKPVRSTATSGQDLGRVEDVVRVERSLDPTHHRDLGLVQRHVQVLAPRGADAVLPGNRAPQRER